MTGAVAMGDGENQVQFMLGQLVAGQKETARKIDAMFEKLDGMDERVVKNEGALGVVKSDVDSMKPYIEDYKKNKQRGLGLMAGIGVGGGGAGAGVATLLSKWLGGGT